MRLLMTTLLAAAISASGCALSSAGSTSKPPVACTPPLGLREVLSKAPWLCLQGGYFPQVDHLVPPDVPLGHYRHYARLMRQVVEDPERYLHEARRRGYWDQ